MSRQELIGEGWTDGLIRSQLREGDLIRVASGRYVPKAELEGWPEVAYRVRVRAAAQRFDAIVSHVSAAALYSLPLGGADLSTVHLVRPGRGGFRCAGDRTRHAGMIAPEWLTTVDGVHVTTVARTVVDVARSQPAKVAVAIMDNALFRGLCAPDDIRRAMTSIRRHRGAPQARAACALVDGRAESPTETTVRLAARRTSLPSMELQFDVYDETGRFVGRPDGGFPERGVAWEYDGRGKYGDLLAPGRTPADAFLAEKRRERLLLELGWTVVRIDQEDLVDLRQVLDRLSRAVLAASRPGWNAPRGTVVFRPPVTIW